MAKGPKRSRSKNQIFWRPIPETPETDGSPEFIPQQRSVVSPRAGASARQALSSCAHHGHEPLGGRLRCADGQRVRHADTRFQSHEEDLRYDRPPPSKIYVLLDERDDSINDGYYVVTMDGPAQQNIVDYPSSYHNGAGGFSFADGHAEIHKWVDPRTGINYKKDSHLRVLPRNPSRNNRDVSWLQERATGRK